ncbi:hypothetical protein CSB45_14360 [candidate division KSB3 bacterium]|uniref:Uncharacterized protein n=1 Tax=candidate division KSB3 bacterium TaxID=2044937 RepID=A0A2G6E1L3_9BACT|nr:MAG: hypothetical protein CSB45_14360 [candidate division KSB3 bacterium]PIE30337.1 MAG: hypothetical protein CSA57_03360 [candidate division KSB3 bacterium]
MTCKDIQRYLLDYSEFQLDPRTHAQIEDHLRHCETCTKVVNDFEQTVELLHSTSTQQPSEEFWEEFSSGVMRQVRKMKTPSRSLKRYLFPDPRIVAVALAALIIILGTILLSASGVVDMTAFKHVLSEIRW